MAFGNGQFGVNINNDPITGTAAPNVTLTNGRYVANGDDGLEVNTRGTITAKNIGSAWNSDIGSDTSEGHGAHLVSTGLGKAISITNNLSTATNYIPGFENSGAIGLWIDSMGAVTLTNVTATYNVNGYGVYIDNTDGAGPLTINNIYLADNGNDGLNAKINGVISLKNATSEYNDGNGATLSNNSPTTGKPGVTLVNILPTAGSVETGFNGNGQTGLQITSLGVISLTNISAGYNGSNGAVLQNYNGATDVKITGGWFDGNNYFGLEVLTKGNITYNKGSANDNINAKGASLESYPSIGAKNITITGVQFNSNYGTGLYARVNGNITLTNVSASYNIGENVVDDYAKGADLNNCPSGDCTLPVKTGNIVVKNGDFSGNNDSGLFIDTYGNVTLTTVTANDNVSYGAFLGDFGLANVVAISGMSTFYNNGDSGLEVYSTGAITLTNVDAAQNQGDGANLDNTYAVLPANVSLFCTLSNWTNWFGQNEGGNGLEIQTKGAVVVNKIDASNNSGTGLVISNQNVTILGNVTVNAGWFYQNSGYGLLINTKGVTIINSIVANENSGGSGASINNSTELTGTKAVTVNKSILLRIKEAGLEVYSLGNIITSYIIASSNTNGSGMFLDNQLPGGIGVVTESKYLR